MDGKRARGRSELRGDGRLDLERRAHGAQAIVAVGARRAEQRHRGVADMLVDRAAVAVDDGVDDAEKLFEHRVDFLGVDYSQIGLSRSNRPDQPAVFTGCLRLTLNVLLSFAQFEREVTSERIRDKIAASNARACGSAAWCRSDTTAGP